MGAAREGSRRKLISTLSAASSSLGEALKQLESSPNTREWVEVQLTLGRTKALVHVLETANEWTFMASKALAEPELARRHREALEEDEPTMLPRLPEAPEVYPPSRMARLFMKAMRKGS